MFVLLWMWVNIRAGITKSNLKNFEYDLLQIQPFQFSNYSYIRSMSLANFIKEHKEIGISTKDKAINKHQAQQIRIISTKKK